MRASKYEGIKHLDTNIEVGVGLKVVEYLFDKEADGKIDIEQKDGNFTLHLTKEGRYKPRVTVKTEKGLLYSSDYYALSLDVKANANQKDPKGAEPLDVAKAFVKAIENDDRQTVDRLVGHSKNSLNFIYGNKDALKRAKSFIKTIDNNSWEQTYNSNGSIEVKVQAYDSKIGKFPIVFEVMPAYGDGVGYGRFLYISDFH